MISMPLSAWAATLTCLMVTQQPANLLQPTQPPAQRAQSTSLPAPEHLRELRFLDVNVDRRIDAKELAAGQYYASMILMLDFDECDRDGDGWIAPDEFHMAAEVAEKEMRETNLEGAEQAQDALAKAITLKLLLDQLAEDAAYAAEIAALRQEIKDLSDEDVVVSYIIKYPTRFPRLRPILYTWGHYYPVRSSIHKVIRPRPLRFYRPPVKLRTPGSAQKRPGVYKSGPKTPKSGPKMRKSGPKTPAPGAKGKTPHPGPKKKPAKPGAKKKRP